MSKYAKQGRLAKIGDPSSKYGLGRDLDADIQNKHEVFEQIHLDIAAYLDLVLNEKIEYNDGSVMGRSTKLDAMRQAYMDILRQEGEIE